MRTATSEETFIAKNGAVEDNRLGIKALAGHYGEDKLTLPRNYIIGICN